MAVADGGGVVLISEEDEKQRREERKRCVAGAGRSEGELGTNEVNRCEGGEGSGWSEVRCGG